MGYFVEESSSGRTSTIKGRFNLIVSLRYPSDDNQNEMIFFKELFQEVSNALFRATIGQHCIGRIWIAQNHWSEHLADIFIYPEATAFPDSTNARLWIPNESMDIDQFRSINVSLLVHELSHYLYNLKDEYKYVQEVTITCDKTGTSDENGKKCVILKELDSCCLGDIGKKACIMEYTLEEEVFSKTTRWRTNNDSEFSDYSSFIASYLNNAVNFYNEEFKGMGYCDQTNHGTGENCLNDFPFPSCWEQITEAGDDNHGGIPYGLSHPVSVPVFSEMPIIECNELIQEERVVFILDSSSENGRFEEMQSYVNLWIENIGNNEKFGLLTFSNDPLVVESIPMTLPNNTDTSWKSNQVNIVNNISNSGIVSNEMLNTSIELGLTSLSPSPSDRAANQVLILLFENYNSDQIDAIAAVIPSIIERGVRLYLLSFNNSEAPANASELSNMAEATGGGFINIMGNQDYPTSTSLTPYINGSIQLVNEVEENRGVSQIFNQSKLAFASNYLRPPRGNKIKIPLFFTKGSTEGHVTVVWDNKRHQNLPVKLFKRKKDIAPTKPYEIGIFGIKKFKINEIGRSGWFLEIENTDVKKGGIEFFTSEVNKNVRIACNVLSNDIKKEGKLILKTGAFYKAVFLDTARVKVVVQQPSGYEKEFGALWPGVHSLDVPFEKEGLYLISITIHQKKEAKEIRVNQREKGGENKFKEVNVPQIYREQIIPVWVSNRVKKSGFIYGYAGKKAK